MLFSRHNFLTIFFGLSLCALLASSCSSSIGGDGDNDNDQSGGGSTFQRGKGEAPYILKNGHSLDTVSAGIHTISVVAPRDYFLENDMSVEVDGQGGQETQVDVISTWIENGQMKSDGSNLLALVSTRLDRIAPEQELNIKIIAQQNPPSNSFTLPDGLEKQLSFEFDLHHTDGTNYLVHFSESEAKSLIETVKAGDESERMLGGAYGALVRDIEKKFRVRDSVGNIHPTLMLVVRWRFLHHENSLDDYSMRVRFNVENSRKADEELLKTVNYSETTISMGKDSFKQEVARLTNNALVYHTRFTVEAWTGESHLANMIARPAPDHFRELAKVGLFPPLNPDHRQTDEAVIQSYIETKMAQPERGDFDIDEIVGIKYNRGPISENMPGTSDRIDIGWIPRWTALMLNSLSLRAHRLAIAGAINGSGIWQVYTRNDSEADGLKGEAGIHIDDKWWGGVKHFDKTDPVENTAHQPELGAFEFMVQGDKEAVESLIGWAIYGLHDNYPFGEGLYKEKGRKMAWMMRSTCYAVALAPDNHPLKAHLLEMALKNGDKAADDLGAGIDTNPTHVYADPKTHSSGRTPGLGAWQSPWTANWAATMLSNVCYNLLGYDKFLKPFQYHWEHLRQGYGERQEWVAPSGEVIVHDCTDLSRPDQDCYVMQYSKFSYEYDGYYDGSGDWVIPDMSEWRSADNFGHAMWMDRIGKDYPLTEAGGGPGDCPPEGCEYRYWRPLAGHFTPVDATNYDEYGIARTGTCTFAKLYEDQLNLANVEQTCAVIESRSEYQYDTKSSGSIMRALRLY